MPGATLPARVPAGGLIPAEGPVACVGLGFGDEGKGKLVDFLCRRLGAPLALRFGGGPQAAHHVVTEANRCHCFAQFAAGALVPGTRVLAARGMLVDPLALEPEAGSLAAAGLVEPFGALSIDPRCLVVTPWQQLVGQMRELGRGRARRGSCGRGVGETVRDAAWLGAEALVFGDLLDPAVMRRKLRLLRAAKLDHAEQIMTESGPAPGLGERLDRLRATNGEALAGHYGRMATRSGVRVERDSVAAPLLRQRAPVLFEGAHGVLLDRENGLRPHVTSTDTTLAPATALLAELSPGGRPFRLGVVRAYATRHGAGPFPTEDAMLTERLPEAHNVANEWQGRMRAGWLDLAALRHALAVAGGIDALAVTCLDRLSGLASVRVAVGYEPAGGPGTGHAGPLGGGRPVLGELAGWSEDLRGCRRPADLPEAARRFLRFLASSAGLGVPIALVSVGPRAAETIFWEDDE